MSSCNATLPASKINPKNKSVHGKTNYNKTSETFKNEKLQQKSDQTKQAHNSDSRINSKEDVAWQERIKQVMELTRRTEDEVIMALHDSDGDLNRAANDLLEGVSPEWEVKKKKARPTGGPRQNSEVASDINIDWEDKRFSHSDGLLRSRGRISHNNRGWRRKENKENEKNIEDVRSETSHSNLRRGRGISGRSGRGGRGAGRSLGPRTFANRGDSSTSSNSHNFTRPIDTWTGNEDQFNNYKALKMDSWSTVDVSEDWDNEEYTGSLADTKVFTPSTLNMEGSTITEESKSNEIPLINSLQTSTLVINDYQRQPKPKPRVPPPSKIPSSAVEMPGDALNNSISFLDVQFGALEFGTDANITDTSTPDKFNSSESSVSMSSADSSAATKSVNSVSSPNVDSVQTSPSQKYSTTTKVLNNECQPIHSEHLMNPQGGFTNRNAVVQSVDSHKQDLNNQSPLSNTTTFSATYPSPKVSYTTVTASNYSTYSCNAQPNQTVFTSSTSCNNNFPTITPSTQTAYNSTYTQSNATTFNQTSPVTSGTSSIYNQTSTASQGFQTNSGFTTPISQYQSQSACNSSPSNNSSYINTGYPNSSTFQSTAQSYQPSTTTFSSSISQGSNVYSNAVQSVYSNTYPTYGCQNQTGSQDHKLSTNKDLQFESNTTTSSNSLVTTNACTLGMTSSSVNVTQSKTTVSNAVPKCTVSGLPSSSSSSSVSTTSGSGTTGNIAPILGHQYIMGQSLPYATFQQPHMYSYEDLQLMQQRMPHMPTSGYYDATLGYQTTTPVTSLGNSRNDALSGVQSVQGVQGVQTVQGQYTSISDARFARTDSNASPVSSTISQQTASQHQQPLINPIPPGYAYFYGGGIMPAGSFQYGTPAIYPQIATAGNAGTTNAAYNTKPGSYSSAYGSGTNYETLANSGPSNDYKSSTSGYSSSQSSKNNSTNGNNNPTGNASDINSTMYTKNHATLNKVSSYEKQTFHSATPPPFGLTNNQSANVISGYGAAHLFIPTVPHQLHQPLHQDSGNNTGQRASTNSQNKSQVKPGYSTSYWAGGN